MNKLTKRRIERDEDINTKSSKKKLKLELYITNQLHYIDKKENKKIKVDQERLDKKKIKITNNQIDQKEAIITTKEDLQNEKLESFVKQSPSQRARAQLGYTCKVPQLNILIK